MPTPADAVHTYILAKDGNRPFLIQRAFAEDAELRIVLKTDAIAFPSAAKGRRAIEDIVVRRFNVDYENVFTFCLAEPPTARRAHFPCHWLVGMSAKADGRLRVGSGRYDWHFDGQGRVEKLVITAEAMKVLPADKLAAVMDWLSALPYPWCSADQALARLPAVEELGEVEAYLKQAGPI
jgi:hypothetical protein